MLVLLVKLNFSKTHSISVQARYDHLTSTHLLPILGHHACGDGVDADVAFERRHVKQVLAIEIEGRNAVADPFLDIGSSFLDRPANLPKRLPSFRWRRGDVLRYGRGSRHCRMSEG